MFGILDIHCHTVISNSAICFTMNSNSERKLIFLKKHDTSIHRVTPATALDSWCKYRRRDLYRKQTIAYFYFAVRLKFEIVLSVTKLCFKAVKVFQIFFSC